MALTTCYDTLTAYYLLCLLDFLQREATTRVYAKGEVILSQPNRTLTLTLTPIPTLALAPTLALTLALAPTLPLTLTVP